MDNLFFMRKGYKEQTLIKFAPFLASRGNLLRQIQTRSEL